MSPYSLDLRERVVQAWDESGDTAEVAATFTVSRAWVHRLVRRRRETGSIAPPQQTKFRSRVLAGQEQRLAALITARPDATSAELRDALPGTGASGSRCATYGSTSSSMKSGVTTDLLRRYGRSPVGRASTITPRAVSGPRAPWLLGSGSTA
jgi:hypothetical protein